MLPNNPSGHTAYQDFLFAQLPVYYPNPKASDSKTWQIIERFYQLDLSHIDEMMKDCLNFIRQQKMHFIQK